MLTSVFVLLNGYQENCPSENCSPEICPREYCLRPPPSENCPQWRNLPPCMNSPPYESSPCENYPPPRLLKKFAPEKIGPYENSPLNKLYKWKKRQIYKIFWLEESCATQHPYRNNQGPLWYTNDLTENTGLRYFLHRMKKNWTKAKIAKWPS